MYTTSYYKYNKDAYKHNTRYSELGDGTNVRGLYYKNTAGSCFCPRWRCAPLVSQVSSALPHVEQYLALRLLPDDEATKDRPNAMSGILLADVSETPCEDLSCWEVALLLELWPEEAMMVDIWLSSWLP